MADTVTLFEKSGLLKYTVIIHCLFLKYFSTVAT